MKITLKIYLLLVLLLAIGQPCYAHKVRIFAWQEGAEIVTESKFSGGRAARNVTIAVVDTATGQQLLSGSTDNEGLFRFPVPTNANKDLKIIVDTGDGHKNSWIHNLQGYGSEKSPVSPAAEQGGDRQEIEQSAINGAEIPGAALAAIDAQQLTLLLEEVMERKLAPIRRSLAENTEQGPGLRDILGGIGYIFGLAGIAAYIRFRKDNKE